METLGTVASLAAGPEKVDVESLAAGVKRGLRRTVEAELFQLVLSKNKKKKKPDTRRPGSRFLADLAAKETLEEEQKLKNTK